MALRKNTAPDDYSVSDLFINEAVNNEEGRVKNEE